MQVDEFSPNSKKIHVDIDPSSIGKNIKVDLAIVSDVSNLLKALLKDLKKKIKFLDSIKRKHPNGGATFKWREKNH